MRLGSGWICGWIYFAAEDHLLKKRRHFCQHFIDDKIRCFLAEAAIVGTQVEGPELVAEDDARCISACAGERYGKALLAREIAAASDGNSER